MILHLATINVPAKVGRKAWEKCFEETAKRADLFGVNEAFSLRQKATFRRRAKAEGFRQYGLYKGPNPIFHNPNDWRRVRANTYRLHGRGPLWRRWPGFNGSRSATVALFHPVRSAGAPVAVVNTHWVPRGPKVPRVFRDRARRRSERVVARIVRAHLDRGHVVVVMGDLNMTTAPDLPGVEWVHDRGVDKIGVACPEGWEMTGAGSYRYPAPTDHKKGAAAAVWLQRA